MVMFARMPVPSPDTDLREKVLDASIALIEEKGLTEFSLREVARRAGVSHQAPYHYFADREAILAALCERGFDMLFERVSTARAAGESAADRFERAAMAYVTFAFERPAHFRMMFRPELVDQTKHRCLEESANRAFELLPAMVLECVGEGLPPEPSIEALVTTTWSFVHGLAFLILDGSLETKLPGAQGNREGAAREAVKGFRMLIDAAIALHRSPASGPAKRDARKGGEPRKRRG
jgi:AcrR family transcriptional regulator